jgi:hypothetical protein
MSYGAYLPDIYRLAGQQANKIMSAIINHTPLPADVIDAHQTKDATAKFELTINLDTATALSTTILANAKTAAKGAALVIGPSPP